MDSQTIRQRFIDFFVEHGHLNVPSLSLVPHDPGITTLFTIAGMQQMIGYFVGREEPPCRRLVTVQRAIRTGDIEEVGDGSHLTFLEMLGNFSVGDYFKREAIAFTWEFLTRTMGIPPERWWATIFPGDEVSREAWLAVGMPPERIGESEENWWQQGPIGPCGPDSEIHFDRGEAQGCGALDCRPENECCDRFLETWNNVFMQFYQEESGERRPLPWPNIDTGMGLERLAAVVQGVQTVYDTDLFQPIIRTVAVQAGVTYGQDERADRSLRIISDHSRAITFMIADGVMPSAEGRGYVLRRLLRRASMHGRLLGITRPFLREPVQAVIDTMSDYYVELVSRQDHILQVVQFEEQRFLLALSRGLGIFEDVAGRAAQAGGTISGEDAFLLSDTHGFPVELTEELAQSRGLHVDRAGFERAFQRQQERAREHTAFRHGQETSPETYVHVLERLGQSIFTGYDELTTTTEVVAIIAEGKEVSRADIGDQVQIVFAATPFYAESGGQVGDTGVIRGDNGEARVDDTQRPATGLIVHEAEIVRGSLSVGDVVRAEVNAERRLHIVPHHSGTHLLHKALQEVLGAGATQAGSLVAPDRLRFDFRWPRPITPDELREVEDRVNAAIWANLPVHEQVIPYDDAIREGAMALFGEKYGDRVRVISMGDWSKELCGGTHVDATGDIGLLTIVSETGIGSGVRRIEALAGAAAYAFVQDLRGTLQETAEALETRPDNIVSRARQVTEELGEQEKRIEALTQQLAAREAEALVRDGTAIDGFMVVAQRVPAQSKEYLKATSDAIKSRLDRGIVVLGSVVEGSPAYVMAVTRNLKEQGYNAGTILREAARSAEGRAGGNAEFAQGGGGDASRVDDVLQTAVALIRQKAEE